MFISFSVYHAIINFICQYYHTIFLGLFWNANRNISQVSYDHRSYESNLSNCVQKPEKVRTSTGFEPVTSRRSKQLSYEANDVESWSFVSSNGPVKNGCELINAFITVMIMYLLTEWEGRMGKYLARGHGVRTERSEVHEP